MREPRLRLGAFGVGRMGQVHLEHLIALHQAGGIELVAIGDRHPPMLSSASRLLAGLAGRIWRGSRDSRSSQSRGRRFELAQANGSPIATAADAAAYARAVSALD